MLVEIGLVPCIESCSYAVAQHKEGAELTLMPCYLDDQAAGKLGR